MTEFRRTDVTAPQAVLKTSNESFTLAVSFANLLGGSSLSSVTSVSAETIQAGDSADGSAFSAGSGSISGSSVNIPVSGGYDGADHLIRVKVTLANSAVREGTVLVRIRNQ